MILDEIPKNVRDLLLEIEKLGFRLCLVGGAVRNYLSQNALGNDLDFEARSIKTIPDEEWEKYFSKISEYAISKKLKVDNLPYLIVRIHIDQFTLEFSSPRQEIFQAGNHQHHNFVPKLSSTMTYEDSFKRRDFTINAIGIELNLTNNTCETKDPYQGQIHLKQMVLEKISDDFFLDSVRFIRLIRFKTKLNFEISHSILDNLKLFNLSELSDYHFRQELSKTDIGAFLNHFIYLIKTNNMQISPKLLFLSTIDYNFPDKKINNLDDIIYFSLFVDEISTEAFTVLFQRPKNLFPKLLKLKKALNYFETISFDFFKEEIKLELSKFKNTFVYEETKIIIDQFILYSNVLPFATKNNFLTFDKLKRIKEFKLTDELRNSVIPELRSVYEIHEGLKNEFT